MRLHNPFRSNQQTILEGLHRLRTEPEMQARLVGAFCPACGERVRPSDPHVQRDDVRWHLDCTTLRLRPYAEIADDVTRHFRRMGYPHV